ncbi:MAG: nucleotidyltransferase family protein [Firmicutes bacterium]|nr:nucleotidyltransferase family protein [Bacillota bacterium]
MDIAGIICEFDPFHNGHAYLISKAREQGASGIVWSTKRENASGRSILCRTL